MVQHLALIMDGNRRWAKRQSLMPWLGHQQGTETVQRVIEFCLDNNINNLSLYTFSLENFKRSTEEITYLFNIIIEQADKALPKLLEQGVCIKFIGDKKCFPESVWPTVEKLESQTAHFSNLKLNILFCYGARQEIVAATINIAQDVQAGKIELGDIDQALFEKYLWSNFTPEPDLIIRTGGIKRLSNFLLYQAAYSEIYFTDCLWPDLTKEDLKKALEDFKQRKRNFGA